MFLNENRRLSKCLLQGCIYLLTWFSPTLFLTPFHNSGYYARWMSWASELHTVFNRGWAYDDLWSHSYSRHFASLRRLLVSLTPGVLFNALQHLSSGIASLETLGWNVHCMSAPFLLDTLVENIMICSAHFNASPAGQPCWKHYDDTFSALQRQSCWTGLMETLGWDVQRIATPVLLNTLVGNIRITC